MPDTIHVRGLTANLFIGVHDFEKEARQRVLISAWLEVDAAYMEDAAQSRRYVSYSEVVDFVTALEHATEHIELVEDLALRLCRHCLGLDGVEAVTVDVTKPDIYDQVDGVGITVRRERVSG